jgi:hypothetical protein
MDIIPRFAVKPFCCPGSNLITETPHADVRLSMCFLWSSVGSHSKDQRRAAGRLPCLPGARAEEDAVHAGFPPERHGWYETDFKTGAKKNLAGGDKLTELNAVNDTCSISRWCARPPPNTRITRSETTTMMRSHYCGQLNESLDGQEVTLCGWVHRRRDHGGVIFLDIRDREGLAQVVFDPDRAETFAAADRVRSEYVVKITGKVRLRPAGAVNANMASGMIEVLGYELEVLNEAETRRSR